MNNRVRTPRLEKLPEDAAGLPQILAAIKRNFEELTRYFDQNGQLNAFKALNFEVPLGASEVKIKHGLNSVPRDFILSRLLAPSGAKLTVHFNEFTDTDIVVSMTGSGDTPAKVRALVGTLNSGEEVGETFETNYLIQEFKSQL